MATPGHDSGCDVLMQTFTLSSPPSFPSSPAPLSPLHSPLPVSHITSHHITSSTPAAEDPLSFWAADSFSFPYITPATPLLTRGSTRKRFFAVDLSVAADVAATSQSDDPAPGAIFFPRRLPLLYPSSSPPFPSPFPLPRSSPSSSPSSSFPQPSASEPPACMARSFTFTYGFSINVSASQGLAFVISTHAGVGLGGAYMGYGRDPSSRLANGSWPDGARSVAVEWRTVTNPEGNRNGVKVGVTTDFNMTSVFAKESPYVMEPEEVWQMRVDYNGSSKEMALRWYRPPFLRGIMRVSIDLCAALSDASDTAGSSSGSTSGSGGGSSSSDGSSDGSSDSSSGVTDPASPSFGQLFVGFTSAALPPPSGRLPSPVTLFSWTFRFTGTDPCTGSPVLPCGTGVCSKALAPWGETPLTSCLIPSLSSLSNCLTHSLHPPPTDTDPCTGSPVLPCGTGVCTKAPASWDSSILVPSCKCPFNLPSFQPAHLSGLPSCFPDSFRCRQFIRNPCAPGVCIDDIDGTYSCLCPSPFFAFYFYSKDTARCNQLRLFELRMPTFLSPYGLTCPLIFNTYGLTQAAFFRQNKGFQCRVPIPAETLINVTSRAYSQCTSTYTANYGDSCDSINALFSTRIQSLNPALSCSDGPRPGQLLCVDFNRTWLELEKTRVACQVSAQITPAITTATPPPLVDYMNQGVLVKVLQGPQSCQQLWRAFGVSSPTRFFQMNPGLSCDSLLPYSPLQGNMISRICVAAIDARPLSGVSCSTKRMYSVKRGDTCGMLIVKRYRRSADMFRELNNGYDCAVTGLWIGMLLCLPV
ncbi:unnamed protein product [Closterium sp. NIES-54]